MMEGLVSEIFLGVDPKTRKVLEVHGKLIDFVQTGQIFGEIALVNQNPRTASVIATTDCHLMVFSKESFEYVKETYNQEFIDRKRFLRKVFTSISQLTNQDKINSFAQLFIPKTVILGQVVVHEGDPAKHLFIVQEGTCEVSKMESLPSVNSSSPVMMMQKLTICFAEPGSTVGEECIFDANTYRYTVTAKSSQVRLLCLLRTSLTGIPNLSIISDLAKRFRESMYFQRRLTSRDLRAELTTKVASLRKQNSQIHSISTKQFIESHFKDPVEGSKQ